MANGKRSDMEEGGETSPEDMTAHLDFLDKRAEEIQSRWRCDV